MDTSTYQQRLAARRAELAALLGPGAGAEPSPAAPDADERRRRADAARARSAARWESNNERPAQEQRAAHLHLVPGGGA